MFRVGFAFALAVGASAAPLCTPGASLSSYEALGVAGCEVDPSIPLLVGGFSYSVLASSGPGVITPDTDIFVTPVALGPGHVGIEFTSRTFVLGGTDFVDYQIGFTWDPPDIRSADDILIDPIIPPGLAKLTTTLCLGSAFAGAVCPTSTLPLTVSDDGIAPMLTDSVSFPSVAVLGVLNKLELNGGGPGGSVEITGFSNDITEAPEPSTFLIAAAGFLMILRRSARRSPLQSGSELPAAV